MTHDYLECRINDRQAPNIMVNALGDVDTPLRQGRFHPEKDQMLLDDGSVIDDYYKKHLGVTYFEPLDKSVYAKAPSGWCSWYYHARAVTPEELISNARWIADNLSEYEINLLLIDDGWQGGGRNWHTLRDSFAEGMKSVADKIKSLGLTPGLWLCPQGHCGLDIVDKEGCFLRHENGDSVCGTFCGPHTVDPTLPETSDYLKRLVQQIVEWGYHYLKLDGQPSLLTAYREHRQYFSKPDISAEDAYRLTLKAIRDGAGTETFLCGCSGMPLEPIGHFNGQRTGADVDPEWSKGFMNAVEATMNGYFLHNIGWYSDPDCCMLRTPLTLDMARAWGTMMALTGQLLLFSDRMPDLSPERVDIIKKISPPASDLRPFDLFPSERYKSIIDCKINKNGRCYDVIGVFNYDETTAKVERLDFRTLGLKSKKRHHIYDFWSGDYLGLCSIGVFLEVSPASCRLITIHEDDGFPVLLSTNRHLLQGVPDIREYIIDKDSLRISGSSEIIGGESYELVFGLPEVSGEIYVVKGARVETDAPVKLEQGRGVGRVSWTPHVSGTYQWEVVFERRDMVKSFRDDSYPFMIGARDIDPWSVEVYWISFGSPVGFQIKQNGETIGYAFGNRIQINNLENQSANEFEVAVSDIDGKVYEKSNKINVVTGETLPETLFLSDLDWESASTGYWMVKKDKNVSGASLASGGRRFRKGIGTHPDSLVRYDLKGLFKRLTGHFGIEDQNGLGVEIANKESGRAIFHIKGDGKDLFKPCLKIKGESPEQFDVDITDINKLELIVEKPTDNEPNLAPHANWLDMSVTF